MLEPGARDQTTVTIGVSLCLAVGVWALGGFLIAVAIAVDLVSDGVADGLIPVVMVLGLVIGVVHVVRNRRPRPPN